MIQSMSRSEASRCLPTPVLFLKRFLERCINCEVERNKHLLLVQKLSRPIILAAQYDWPFFLKAKFRVGIVALGGNTGRNEFTGILP